MLARGDYEASVRGIAIPTGARQRSITPAPHPAVPPAPQKSIVLVDDEKSYTDLLTQMLAENLDCPVYAYSRPLDALKALPEANPGVIVTDYHMPQLDGLEFIREASQVAPAAHFVLISGHNLSTATDRMARLTALKSYMPKPFGWRKLAEEILRVWPEHTPAPGPRAADTAPL